MTEEDLDAAMFLCDMEAFKTRGRPVTEAVYIKGASGPLAMLPGEVA